MAIDPITGGIVAAAWLWSQYGKGLTDKLLGVAKKPWQDFDWARASKRYRESLREQHATIRILGKSDPVLLEGIFTDVYILNDVTARSRYDIEELRKWGGDRSEFGRQKQDRHEGLKLIERAKDGTKNFFILGKPGAGKTTFLRYITLQAINGEFDKVPIFIPLHEWSMETEDALMPFIVKQFDICNFPDAQPFIEALLGSGKAIVLFDGLDEVKMEGDRRRRLTLSLNDFAKKYGDTQVLITCRIAASDYLFAGFRDVEVADFTRDQIHAYAHKWFGDAPNKGETFVVELDEQRNAGLRELCANPLLLSMLCLAFDRTMRFPARRAELYEDATEALLEKWDSSRGIRQDDRHMRDELYHGMSRQQKVRLLAALAAEAFENGHYFLEKKRLVPRIVQYVASLPGVPIADKIDGGDVLKAIEVQHGLLVERANDIYAYSHLSLQEYFTSKYIADNEVRGTVKRLVRLHLTDNRWREVFLLTASILGIAEDFLGEMQHAIDSLAMKDEGMTKLLFRVTQTAIQSKEYFQSALRAVSVFLVLLLARANASDDAATHARSLALTLDRAHPRNRANARASAFALAHARDRVRAFDRVLNRSMDLALALDSSLPLNRERNNTLHTLDLARDRALDKALDRALNLDLASTHALKLAFDLARSHVRDRDIDRFRSRSLARAHGLDIDTTEKVYVYDPENSPLVLDYLYATQLFVDCLNVAVVNNRREIQGSLLMPPQRNKVES